MNPILFYPQNANDAKILQEFADSRKMVYVSIAKQSFEIVDNNFYIDPVEEGAELEYLKELHKVAKPVSMEELQNTFNVLLGRV